MSDMSDLSEVGSGRAVPGRDGKGQTVDLEQRVADLQTIPLAKAGQLLGIGRNKSYDLARENHFPVPVLSIEGKLRVRVKLIEEYLDAESLPA